jgi:response regulator RpfG family c-di-GMP phosphodiesterase
VALLIVGHRLGGMTGVDFLARAHAMHLQAKRVLLVERDYSARSPVIRAMTLGQADYHLTKPWVLEQDLYREISGFLAEWAKDQKADFELFQLIGRLQGRETHQLRELLTRSTSRSVSTTPAASRAEACSTVKVWTHRTCRS